MGMPIAINIADASASQKDIDSVFDYFHYVDEKFSTYKDSSEISRINRKEIDPAHYSSDMQEVFRLSEETKKQTNGYFDIKTPQGNYDPSGLVKGWAIYKAAQILSGQGFKNFYVDAGGDLEIRGLNSHGQPWTVGIRNPFNPRENVKILSLTNSAVATSGTYLRGKHIYNPHSQTPADEIVSLSVIGPNIYEADRFATAAFAMGKEGVYFIEQLEGFEGYSIDTQGLATMTTNFNKYVQKNS